MRFGCLSWVGLLCFLALQVGLESISYRDLGLAAFLGLATFEESFKGCSARGFQSQFPNPKPPNC